MGEPLVISYFDDFEDAGNAWRFLSNFYVGAPLTYRTKTYASGEHMFQAFKGSTWEDHDAINAGATPGEAKANGRHYLRLRPDWEWVKFDVMRLVLRTKFQPGREECGLLLATGDAMLVEGTNWGDKVWGVDLKGGRASPAAEQRGLANEGVWEPGEGWEFSQGRNWLGTLLMARRAELYAEVRGAPRMPYAEVCRVAETLPPGK